MSWRRSWAIIRHEMKALTDDPGSLIFLLVMPLLMMGLMKPLFGLSLQAEGFVGANGAEQAVPGMAAMFATFTGSFAGFTFFREHGWHTWDRLRASRATTPDIMTGKLVPTLIIAGSLDERQPNIAKLVTPYLDGKNVQIAVIEGAGHFFRDFNIEEAMEAAIEFIDE